MESIRCDRCRFKQDKTGVIKVHSYKLQWTTDGHDEVFKDLCNECRMELAVLTERWFSGKKVEGAQ